jgi:glutamyl-tRNA reductase
MERLALIGVSHRRGGARALEAWHAAHEETWRDLRASFPEVALVATCNRVDLLLALPKGVSADEARTRLTPPGAPGAYAYVGEAALEHLCRVAASLDSLNPGEDQVMAQVREALEAARAAGTLGPRTTFAFDVALRAAKRVRREVPLAPANTSLFSLARPELERALPADARVAVLGAGEMGALAARSLAGRPRTELLIVNRTMERAEALAAELGAEAVALDDFVRGGARAHALVCATPVRGLIGADFLAASPLVRAIVDLGMPANVDREAAVRAGVHVWDIDNLRELGERRREQMRVRLARAEAIASEEIEKALDSWTEQTVGPAIRKLREQYLDTVRRVAGDGVSDEVAEALAHRFAHFPIRGLRGLARAHGAGAARTFLAEAGLLEESNG